MAIPSFFYSSIFYGVLVSGICIGLVIFSIYSTNEDNKKFAQNGYAKGYEEKNKLTKDNCYWEVSYLQTHYRTDVFKDGFKDGYFKWLEYDYQKVRSLGCTGLPEHLKEFDQYD